MLAQLSAKVVGDVESLSAVILFCQPLFCMRYHIPCLPQTHIFSAHPTARVCREIDNQGLFRQVCGPCLLAGL